MLRDAAGALWIFGYGSLLWRPGFPFEERAAAYVLGWARRLEQGSPDHRGTPERLGRVATLVRAPGERAGGAVFRVAARERDAILQALDRREIGGYDRVEVHAELSDRRAVDALTWIASPTNPYHLGPATADEIAREVRAAAGPSGTNLDYVLRLAETLRELGVDDPHVFAVAARLGAAAVAPASARGR